MARVQSGQGHNLLEPLQGEDQAAGSSAAVSSCPQVSPCCPQSRWGCNTHQPTSWPGWAQTHTPMGQSAGTLGQRSPELASQQVTSSIWLAEAPSRGRRDPERDPGQSHTSSTERGRWRAERHSPQASGKGDPRAHERAIQGKRGPMPQPSSQRARAPPWPPG